MKTLTTLEMNFINMTAKSRDKLFTELHNNNVGEQPKEKTIK